MHIYDPAVYNLVLFTATGRKRKTKMLVGNFMRAQQACKRWQRRTGGSAVIMLCLYNSQLGRPTYSPRHQ